MTVFDQFDQVAKEEGQQQGSDMGAVHIGVGHDDDATIAQPLEGKIIAYAGAQSRYQGSHLVVAQKLIQSSPLGVENFTPQGQNGLKAAIAPLLGTAPGAVTLNNV